MHGAEFRGHFLDLIQEMDQTYLAGIRKKQEAQATAKTGDSDVVAG